MNFFTFNDKKSYDYGLIISGEATFDSPKRDVSNVKIPGKNGDLIIDNGRFNNITVKYPAAIIHSFRMNAGRLREWLLESSAYKKLYDTYHPETYRLGYYNGNITFQTTQLNLQGQAELTFDCKPQRFYFSGDLFTQIASDGTTLVNPSRFSSNPVIKITGSGAGTITVGDHTITIGNNPHNGIVIDCDLQDAYYGNTNCNGLVTRASFPCHIGPGSTEITWTGNFTKVEVQPKWWTI